MSSLPRSVEGRLKEMFSRWENNVRVPTALPVPIRRRVRRRIALNAATAGGLVLLLIAGMWIGIRALDRGLAQRPAAPVTLSPGRSVTVAEGSTETLAWRVTVSRTTWAGVETSLLATTPSRSELYQVAESELHSGDRLSYHTYLPVELYDGRPASGIIWGSIAPDVSQVRIQVDGCSKVISAADVRWILVGGRKVGVWATTVCSGTGTLTAQGANGGALVSQPIDISKSNSPSVIALSTVGGRLWVLGRDERMMRLQIGGPRERAVVISLRQVSSGGGGESYLPPGEVLTAIRSVGAEPDFPRRGAHFVYGFVPADAAHVSIALADGRVFDASIISNRGDGFGVFFAQVPDTLAEATVVAFDGSCREMDRQGPLAGEPPASPVTPTFSCSV